MLRSEALVSIGKIVEVFAGVDGNYIGELINNIYFGNVAAVKILACTRYPSQRTVIYKFNNFERWPLLYGAAETFSVDCLELYYGVAIPEYYELMRSVLNDTFLIETEADRRIFERHKTHWEGRK